MNLGSGDGSMPLRPPFLLGLTPDRSEMCGQGCLPIMVPLPLLYLLLQIPQLVYLLQLLLSPVGGTMPFVSAYLCGCPYVRTPLLLFTLCFLSRCFTFSRSHWCPIVPAVIAKANRQSRMKRNKDKDLIRRGGVSFYASSLTYS